jgi:hypothetical protein
MHDDGNAVADVSPYGKPRGKVHIPACPPVKFFRTILQPPGPELESVHMRQAPLPLLATVFFLSGASAAQPLVPTNITPRPVPQDVAFLTPTFKPGVAIDEANRTANARSRLLVIAFPNEATGAAVDPAWDHTLVRAWINQHAEAIRFADIQEVHVRREVFRAVQEMQAGMQLSHHAPDKLPYGAIFVDGKLTELIGENGLGPWQSRFVPGKLDAGPATLLAELQFGLETISAGDPVWAQTHELKNPPLEPPPMPTFHDGHDDLAPACHGPESGEDPIDLLERARSLRAGDQNGPALGLYTWMWERLAASDPIFRPARSAIIAKEFGALAAVDRNAQTRLRVMCEQLQARQLWWGSDQWIDGMALGAASSGGARAMAMLAAADDDDATALTSNPEQEWLGLVADTDWNAAARPDGANMRWLQDQLARLSRPAQPGTEPDDQAELDACRSRLIFDRACVLHASLLAAHRDTEALQAAELLLSRIDELKHAPHDRESVALYTPQGTRAALAATAMTMNASRPRHADLVRESPQPASRAWMLKRLERGKTAAPPGSHTP